MGRKGKVAWAVLAGFCVLAMGLPLAAADEEESDPWDAGDELLLADGEEDPEVWEDYPFMEDPLILDPYPDACVLAGAEVACEALNPGDWDTRVWPEPSQEFQDAVSVDWDATGGAWKNGVNEGEDVTWVAPQQPGQYGIFAYSRDQGGDPYIPDRDDLDDADAVVVYVVGVQKMEYSADAGQTWMDIPETLSVPKGAEVRFRAIRTGGYGWPEGKPVWGGNAGAQGVGDGVTVTFNTLSTTANDFKTVTVECGNTITANVVVCQLAGLQSRIGEDDWEDVPAVIYIPVETVVEFLAVISPAGAPWPEWPIAKPVWTGAWGTEGPFAQKSFDQVSTTPEDFFPVSAECGNTLSTNVLVLDVRIVQPEKPMGVMADYFLTEEPYRFGTQAVVSGAPGDPEAKQIRVEGTALPGSCHWDLHQNGGTFDDYDIAEPEHTPPANPTEGETLGLESKIGETFTGVRDERTIVVFQDHLARDMANFLNLKESSPRIELYDGSKVERNLTCGPAANHAFWGKTTGGEVWKNTTYYEPYTTAQNFDPGALYGDPARWVRLQWAVENVTLVRGDIIGYVPEEPRGDPEPHHVATAASAQQVYCGDTSGNTGRFHHDTMAAYPGYDGVDWDPATTYVTIWRQK